MVSHNETPYLWRLEYRPDLLSNGHMMDVTFSGMKQFRVYMALVQLIILLMHVVNWLDPALQAKWLWVVWAVYFGSLWLDAKWNDGPPALLLDLLLWLLIFMALGGGSHPLIWTMLVPVVIAALRFTRGLAWMICALDSAIYVILWLTSQNHNHNHGALFEQHVVGMWFGFIVVSLALTWLVTHLMRTITKNNATMRGLELKQQEDMQMVKMGALATGLSHDLGTPLNSIKLLVGELRYGDANWQSDLHSIDAQVDRCKESLQAIAQLTQQAESEQLMRVVDFVDALQARFEVQNP